MHFYFSPTITIIAMANIKMDGCVQDDKDEQAEDDKMTQASDKVLINLTCCLVTGCCHRRNI